MASVPPAPSAAPPPATGHGAHAAHGGHPPFLAHHFDTPQQQFDSASLGMWLFLATEILLFSGLFCAYAYFRMLHPEIFYEAYHREYLSVSWGAVNTVVLLVSSFTMATGVWAAQVGRQKLLVAMLAITLLCAGGFLGVKYIEYSHKIHKGLLWGVKFHPDEHDAHGAHDPTAEGEVHYPPMPGSEGGLTPEHQAPLPEGGALMPPVAAPPEDADADAAATETPVDADATSPAFSPGALAPAGAAPADAPPPRLTPEQRVRNMHTFFGIYYLMTGLHGLHVIAGMIAIGWILVLALQGRFSPAYFTPVPMVGLYWHVVDLVWIYLFPLLYLIH